MRSTLQVIAWLITAAAELLEGAIAVGFRMQETVDTIMQGATAESLQASAAAEHCVVGGPSDGTQVGMSIAYAPDLKVCPAAE